MDYRNTQNGYTILSVGIKPLLGLIFGITQDESGGAMRRHSHLGFSQVTLAIRSA